MGAGAKQNGHELAADWVQRRGREDGRRQAKDLVLGMCRLESTRNPAGDGGGAPGLETET